MFYMVCVVANVKVLISSFEFTFWLCFWIGISLIGYYVIYLLMSVLIVSSTMYGEMQETFVMSQNYLVLAFFTFCYIIIDVGMQQVNGEVRAFLRMKREQFQRAKARKHRKDETLEKARITNFENKGFAFSQAPGQDALVTDNLTKRLQNALAKTIFANNVMLQS